MIPYKKITLCGCTVNQFLAWQVNFQRPAVTAVGALTFVATGLLKFWELISMVRAITNCWGLFAWVYALFFCIFIRAIWRGEMFVIRHGQTREFQLPTGELPPPNESFLEFYRGLVQRVISGDNVGPSDIHILLHLHFENRELYPLPTPSWCRCDGRYLICGNDGDNQDPDLTASIIDAVFSKNAAFALQILYYVRELKTHYHPLLRELFQAIAVENRDPSRMELFRGDMRRECEVFHSTSGLKGEKLQRLKKFIGITLPLFAEFVTAYDFNAENARDRFMSEEIAIVFQEALRPVSTIVVDMRRSEFRKIVITGDGDDETCEFDPTDNDRDFPSNNVPFLWQLFAMCKALKETCHADNYREKILNTFTALARYPYIQGEAFGAVLAHVGSHGDDIPHGRFGTALNDPSCMRYDTMYIFPDGSVQCVAIHGAIVARRGEEPADFMVCYTVKCCSPSGHCETKSAGFGFRVPPP
ncbi:MAG: hypothetical protein LBC42_00155 [Puniceicoccales bacterium]|nr:hypothetical protein [Puniceicoccales bacterium]